MAAAAQTTDSSRSDTVATNRKARRDYTILEKMEAGVELRGAEVKSIRNKGASLDESFARVAGGEVILTGLHVAPYSHSGAYEVDPRRPRRLLLHRNQIRRLIGQVAEKGRTLIPLRLYLKRGLIKVELGLCQGKQRADKRETLRRKTAEREAERAVASHRKR